MTLITFLRCRSQAIPDIKDTFFVDILISSLAEMLMMRSKVVMILVVHARKEL